MLFPVNFVLFGQSNFGPRVIARAKEKGIARLALKAMAKTRVGRGVPQKYPKCWYEPWDEPEMARKAVSFTLSQEITATVPPGDERLFRMALDIACDFHPMDAAEQKQLIAQGAGIKPIFPS